MNRSFADWPMGSDPWGAKQLFRAATGWPSLALRLIEDEITVTVKRGRTYIVHNTYDAHPRLIRFIRARRRHVALFNRFAGVTT